ncbi:GTP cyclohydrolase N terminal-domain-containing protein [Gymnopilus junonius]|uniref:GTP cyclohydrolase N terminal-domain-containing protein n=1 Tax=Gymnopilus junonius TaxID=109634 RepID=A0A9P5TFL5_GYMJU|nr:GTP cyclohydrolase N terminal-domain-containing protein [Gymnopilus junonius]
MSSSDAVLTQILAQLEAMQIAQQTMQAKLDALSLERDTGSPLEPRALGSIPSLSTPSTPTRSGRDRDTISSLSASPASPTAAATRASATDSKINGSPSSTASDVAVRAALISAPPPPPSSAAKKGPMSDKEREKLLYPGRVHLSTYPDQHGIHPYTLKWGAPSASERGPVICSRLPSSIKHRNAIGAHSGSYSIYRALSIAMGTLSPTHKPDYSHTEPAVSLPPTPPGSTRPKSVFRKEVDEEGLDVRPSIAVTKAHLKMSELDDAARKGDIVLDGTIVLQSPPLKNVDGSESDADPGIEIAVSKAAVEPVWYLPGVAERFGISESLLRRALFEETGGMYPELITRPDIKVFLPPIGNLTVYIFGNPAFMSDESKELTLRVHDECNGSDVFGSDICTCKPYLTYAIEECIRGAQKGGVGVVVYFRKEGRALGEVTKYLVYNLRKRSGDRADKYFSSTELIAGVKDMRFQPDAGCKIDAMVSMSDMKYDAIVKSGIRIGRRYDLPDHLIPPDSRVEIDAKIAAGYFSSGKQVTEADLVKTVGRTWEETEH